MDPVSGAIHSEALRIVNEVRSYTEISPSGRGLRIITGGALPNGWRNTKKYTVPIELYEHGRYVTITGACLDGAPDAIADRTMEVAALHGRVATAIAPTNGHQPAARSLNVEIDLDDAALLERARVAHSGAKFWALWTGDTSAYGGDDSAADLALCRRLAFYANRDGTRVDRLFRQSGLTQPKWDERRGMQTYGERTTATAIAACTDVQRPQAHRRGGRCP